MARGAAEGPQILACLKILFFGGKFSSKNTKFGARNPLFWNFWTEFRGNIEIPSTNNLPLSEICVGKLQLPAPPNFLTHDAAAYAASSR